MRAMRVTLRRGVTRRAFGAAAVGLGVVGLVVAGGAIPAAAAPPPGHGRPGGGTGGGTGGGGGAGGGATSTPTVGNDISYPQCGTTFPQGAAFGIAGVNGGLANDENPCFGPSSTYPYTQTELYWAVAAGSGTSSQATPSLYVNTADPGNSYHNSLILDWPTSSANGTDPYGACQTTTVRIKGTTSTVGQDSPACAWEYGYDKATQDADWLVTAAGALNRAETSVPVPATASGYPWWLDVETANTWQSGTTGLAMNVADLQGMVAALTARGASVGIYATASQWDQITGGTTAASGSLFGLDDWVPGATTLSTAKSNCTQSAFTGGNGKVTIAQWAAGVDYDYPCP